jgi:hypothetical protein
MTFHGVVLLLAGYQADEARTVRTYRAIVDGCVFFLHSSFRGPMRLVVLGWSRLRWCILVYPPGPGENGDEPPRPIRSAANAIYTDAVSF